MGHAQCERCGRVSVISMNLLKRTAGEAVGRCAAACVAVRAAVRGRTVLRPNRRRHHPTYQHPRLHLRQREGGCTFSPGLITLCVVWLLMEDQLGLIMYIFS